MAQRDGLIARVRHIARGSDATALSGPATESAAVRDLTARVTHLERLVEALQDSVHRESKRHSSRIADLEARVTPGAMGKALSQHNREHGL